MKYYILLPGDTKKDADFDSNTLGEESFNVFYADRGFKLLFELVDKAPEALESVTIITEQGKKLTVEEFLDKTKEWQLRVKG